MGPVCIRQRIHRDQDTWRCILVTHHFHGTGVIAQPCRRMPTTYSSVPSPFYRAWATLLVKYRWVWLVVILSLTVGLGSIAGQRLTIDNSVESFAPGDSREINALHRFRDTFAVPMRTLSSLKVTFFRCPFWSVWLLCKMKSDGSMLMFDHLREKRSSPKQPSRS